MKLTLDNLIGAIDTGTVALDAKESGSPLRGSALGKCPRETLMRLMGQKPRDVDARALRIFEAGNGLGNHMAQALKAVREQQAAESRSELVVELEKEVWTHVPFPADRIEDLRHKLNGNTPLNYIGAAQHPGLKIDKVYPQGTVVYPDGEHSRDPVDGVWLRSRIDYFELLHERIPKIVEFKTKNSWGFKKLNEEGVDDGYLVQVLAQARGLWDSFGHGGGGIYVVYQNKDDGSLKAFEVDAEAERATLDAALDRLRSVLLAWCDNDEDAIAPELALSTGPGKKLPWQCDYCTVGPLRGACVPSDALDGKVQKGITRWTWLS